MEWSNPTDIAFIGFDDAAGALAWCSTSYMLGTWDGAGYLRYRKADGRAAWLRRSVRRADVVYVAFVAPWGSVFDCDIVDASAMMDTYKPDGWRTKTLDGIRLFAPTKDSPEETAERDKARRDRAAEVAREAAERREAQRAHKQRAAARAKAARDVAVGSFAVGDVAAIELHKTGEAYLCRVLALGAGDLPVLVELGTTHTEQSASALEDVLGGAFRWRDLSKWPKGREALWKKGRMRVKTFWGLACKLGAQNNKA